MSAPPADILAASMEVNYFAHLLLQAKVARKPTLEFKFKHIVLAVKYPYQLTAFYEIFNKEMFKVVKYTGSGRIVLQHCVATHTIVGSNFQQYLWTQDLQGCGSKQLGWYSH